MIFVRSDKDTHFTTALIQYASEYEDLSIGGIAPTTRADGIITSIRLLSLQNLAWWVGFYTRRRNYQANYDLDTLVGAQSFVAGDAFLSATTYIYIATGLRMPYQDEDMLGELHVGLHNRSASAKTAGDGGQIQMTIGLL